MHESHRSSQPRPSAGRTGRRAPRAWQDPALWAWVAVAVFALLPLTHAMAAPVRPAAAETADVDELPMSGAMGLSAGLPSVKKLSDNDLSCTAIYLEVTELERTLKAHESAAAASQREMQQAATAMMDSGAAMSGVGAATGLLGMIPGVGGIVGGMVGSVASQAASAAAMASVRERQGHMMDTTQKMVASYQAQAAAAGRRDHLTDLFLARGCKLAEVRAALAKEAGAATPSAAAPGSSPASGAPVEIAAATAPAVPAAAAPAAPAPQGTDGRSDQASAGGGGTP